MSRCVAVAVVVIATAGAACAPFVIVRQDSKAAKARTEAIQHAQVWRPTDVASMDLKAGPQGKGSFAAGETITCDYVDRPLKGRSPKFTCKLGPDDEVKIKYGADNGEVYGEVAATRLLWALGFGADRMYPVKVICRGCPRELRGAKRIDGKTVMFEVAAAERKMQGHEISAPGLDGWAWGELNLVDEDIGGAPREQRDALKLLAAMIQHTDNKPAQQRLLCLDDANYDSKNGCAHPFMMINDLGLTFGQANYWNSSKPGSANFDLWSHTPVWRSEETCVANLEPSVTGTLTTPAISEEGRRFLSGLLEQLSDAQLRDLFAVARFGQRGVEIRRHMSHGFPADWVDAFKKKREEIANRHCGTSPVVVADQKPR